jgi:hypothetical protein
VTSCIYTYDNYVTLRHYGLTHVLYTQVSGVLRELSEVATQWKQPRVINWGKKEWRDEREAVAVLYFV